MEDADEGDAVVGKEVIDQEQKDAGDEEEQRRAGRVVEAVVPDAQLHVGPSSRGQKQSLLPAEDAL